jgi:acyl carrier protein
MGLDTVELVLAVEQLFEIEIPPEAAQELDTVGKLHAFVVAELTRQQRPRVQPDIVFDQLRTVICRCLGVEPAMVVPSAHFVRDLGAD